MNDLTILSTGLYEKFLTPQNGAPIRLVVPWKYGFKSIKSIVKIDLVSEMPVSFWMASVPVNMASMPTLIQMCPIPAGRSQLKNGLVKTVE